MTAELIKCFIFKIKCMSCSLHFMTVSWDMNWYEKRRAVCPECADRHTVLLGLEGSPGQIFEIVPGHSSPKETPETPLNEENGGENANK